MGGGREWPTIARTGWVAALVVATPINGIVSDSYVKKKWIYVEELELIVKKMLEEVVSKVTNDTEKKQHKETRLFTRDRLHAFYSRPGAAACVGALVHCPVEIYSPRNTGYKCLAF